MDPFEQSPFLYRPDRLENPMQELVGSGPSPTDRDSKMLSFTSLVSNHTTLDSDGKRHPVSISAQLHGMFFLAESPWGVAGVTAEPPTELTCYRRNVFQISASVLLPCKLQYLLTDEGDQIPILGQEINISATESIKGNPVDVLSLPWKTSANNTTTSDHESKRCALAIPLSLTAIQDGESHYATIPVSWKRLQFRTSTANNGRRNGMQQHFQVRLTVMATLATGEKVRLAECQSSPIIVRGRNPRNFHNGDDYPLGGSTQNHRSAQPPSKPSVQTAAGHFGPLITEPNVYKSPELPRVSTQYYAQNSVQRSPGFFNWPSPIRRQTEPLIARSPPELPTNQLQFQQLASRPNRSSSDHFQHDRVLSRPSHINLSLTEEDIPTTSTGTAQKDIAPWPSKRNAPRTLATAKSVSSPDEGANLLYEYFPLGLDDWMPPVDAVYRPHAVHHIHGLPDVKAEVNRIKSKRYFSADE